MFDKSPFGVGLVALAAASLTAATTLTGCSSDQGAADATIDAGATPDVETPDASSDQRTDGAAPDVRSCGDAWRPAAPTPLREDEPGDWYRYAPAVIVDGEVTRVWACGNTEPGEVRDHILYSERRGAGTFSPWTVVLAPAQSGWDHFHNCDPSVVSGTFELAGETYDRALFYSGNDKDAINHVQLGVALSRGLQDGGTWQRVGEPLLGHPDDGTWGLGQPSAISLGGGRMLLAYTRADPVPHVYLREIDLSIADQPTLGEEVRLSETGLAGLDGKPDVLTNVDLLLDASNDRLLLVSERHPLPQDDPPGLAAALAVLSMDRQTAVAGSGQWQTLAFIEQATTGSSRNHNAGFFRTIDGTVPSPLDGVTLVYANSCNGCSFPAALFAVRLQQIQIGPSCD